MFSAGRIARRITSEASTQTEQALADEAGASSGSYGTAPLHPLGGGDPLVTKLDSNVTPDARQGALVAGVPMHSGWLKNHQHHAIPLVGTATP